MTESSSTPTVRPCNTTGNMSAPLFTAPTPSLALSTKMTPRFCPGSFSMSHTPPTTTKRTEASSQARWCVTGLMRRQPGSRALTPTTLSVVVRRATELMVTLQATMPIGSMVDTKVSVSVVGSLFSFSIASNCHYRQTSI